MPVTPWKPAEEMSVITKSVPRVDARAKVTGKAQYAYDILPKEALVGRFVVCPHPHAKIVRIDMSDAEKMPGVKAVLRVKNEGDICRYAGEFVAAVAATSEDIADDAIKSVQVDYEPYPFVVREEDAMKPNAPAARGEGRSNVNSGNPNAQGDVDAAFAEADAVVEATYATQVQGHVCLEPHGVTAQWNSEQTELTVWASTQGVFSVRDGLTGALGLDASHVRVICDYMGGGFGSKFGPGEEGIFAARLAKIAKAPVRMMLTRRQEFMTAGNRPSSIQTIKIAGKKDGTVTGFTLDVYGTGGISAGAGIPAPYIYRVGATRIQQRDVYINAGGARAMRAPGHPQASFGIESALDDLADELGLDPIALRKKNDPNQTRQRQYDVAANLIGWKQRKPTGSQKGAVRRGFGIGSATWGGGGGGTRAQVDIHPDGQVVVKCGTQDLGTGARTVVAIVAAEELGLPVTAITALIGDTSFPPSGGSGGSTTTASVAPAIKVTADMARDELFAKVAPALNATPDLLEAKDGYIVSTADPNKRMSWKDACSLLGTETISVQGQHDRSLSSSGVAGCCAVEVEVDTETGKVRVLKAVSVQDCGLVIDKLTTESQIIGGVIQGVSWALYEDRIMDRILGQQINPDMEFYKILTSPDMPEIIPVVWMEPDSLARGVIGIGEPPVIPVAGAIGNAVKNALGVRVYTLPITPAKVLAALEQKGNG
jgi:xanthine dehydrogenase YagR molybdenum-binding subunit